MVYDHSVEALFARALRSRMPEACVRELREAGLDLSKPLRPQYPEAEYELHIRIARRHLFPDLADPEAYRSMGRLFVSGYLETTIGAALKVLLRMLGPERNLARMPGYFEAGTSYVRASGERHGPGDWTLRVSDVAGFPTFTQGSLEETLRLSGARDASVEIERQPDNSVRYRIRWAP
ncbi:MAG TPA: DUF2378 family protein [Myxococcaceae bacterium]|jgi:uncharacterized protein (TIGR02265 family)